MKNILLFVSICFTSILSAQTTTQINFDDASKWSFSGSATAYTTKSYSDGLFSATANNVIRQTAGTQDGEPRTIGTYSWRINQNTQLWTGTVASGGVSTFSLKVRRWDANAEPIATVDYSIDGGSTWVNSGTINNTTLGGSAFVTFSGTINSLAANIMVRVSKTAGERLMFDDFEWTDYTPSGPIVGLGSSNAGDESLATAITLTVTASAFVTGDQTVDVTVTGTGITGTDYTLSSTTITIPNGLLQGTAVFTVLDDTDVEGTETATVTISNPSSGISLGSVISQNIVITDNDFNPDVSLSASASAGSEAAASVITLTATASYAVTSDETVDVTVTGTNINGTDYTLSSNQITILNGATTGTATFTIIDDTDLELPETATITISNPSSGITVVAPTSVTVDITDNDLIIYDLLFNEVLADPSNSGLAGDANNDGSYNFQEDEFVEIYNNENFAVDMSGYTYSDGSVRHTFASGTIVPAKSFITVFGGGTPTGISGIAIASTTGNLGLSNSGDNIFLYDAGSNLVTSFSYTGSGGNNQSFARSPDFTGAFVDHTTIITAGRLQSPGTENYKEPETQVLAWCDMNLPALNTTIYVTEITGADEYHFEISSGGSVIDTIVKSIRTFQLIELPGGANFGTTYNIRSRVKIGATEYAFGTTCFVTTPALPVSQLRPAYCNASIPTLTSSIYAVYHVGVDAWKFKVTDGLTTDSIVKTNTGYFSLSELTTITAAYGTTYTISVATEIGGTYGAYGPTCTVISPLPVSELRPVFCNQNVSSLASSIYAVYYPGVTTWRFQVNDGVTTETIDKTNTGYFNLTELSTITAAYGTTYTIDVSMEIGGVFGAYGVTPCTVTTPAIPTSQLRPAYCNANLSLLTASIYAIYYPGVTTWRFRVSNGVVMDSVDKTNDGNFSLSELTAITASYATTYTIEVAMEINGVMGAYGAPCTMTTPALPVSELRPAYCDGNVPNLGSSIYAIYHPGVTTWRFKVTDGSVTDSVDMNNTGSFVLEDLLTLAPMFGNIYDVQVSMEIGGVFGAYGSSCSISAGPPSLIANGNNKPSILVDDKSIGAFVFETIAYPNPFNDNIRLELTSDDMDSPVIVYVYDATGRMIERKEINLNIDNTMNLGLDYAKGLYQVHLLQNNRMETIRIVKK